MESKTDIVTSENGLFPPKTMLDLNSEAERKVSNNDSQMNVSKNMDISGNTGEDVDDPIEQGKAEASRNCFAAVRSLVQGLSRENQTYSAPALLKKTSDANHYANEIFNNMFSHQQSSTNNIEQKAEWAACAYLGAELSGMVVSIGDIADIFGFSHIRFQQRISMIIDHGSAWKKIRIGRTVSTIGMALLFSRNMIELAEELGVHFALQCSRKLHDAPLDYLCIGACYIIERKRSVNQFIDMQNRHRGQAPGIRSAKLELEIVLSVNNRFYDESFTGVLEEAIREFSKFLSQKRNTTFGPNQLIDWNITPGKTSGTSNLDASLMQSISSRNREFASKLHSTKDTEIAARNLAVGYYSIRAFINAHSPVPDCKDLCCACLFMIEREYSSGNFELSAAALICDIDVNVLWNIVEDVKKLVPRLCTPKFGYHDAAMRLLCVRAGLDRKATENVVSMAKELSTVPKLRRKFFVSVASLALFVGCSESTKTDRTDLIKMISEFTFRSKRSVRRIISDIGLTCPDFSAKHPCMPTYH